MPVKQKHAIDIDGSDVMSTVLMDLLNTFPGLSGRKIEFSTLSETSGIGFFPTSGAAILSDKEDVTGHVEQVCLYPFSIVYRSAPKTEAARLKIKEFLDTIGKWLEQQPISIGSRNYQLSQYPVLTTQGRAIKSIRRTNPGHLEATYQDGIEDWSLAASLKYENNFNK